MKCSLCKSEIEITFLNKIHGTFVIYGKKKVPVCSACQRLHQDMLPEQISS